MAISLTFEQQYDAFGRQRISNPVTLFDANHVSRVNPNMDFSGSYTYDISNSLIMLDSSGGQVSIMQSKQIIPYQPGKSMLVFGSFVMSDSVTSTERIGFFNGRHGLYVEKNNGMLSFNVKRNTDTSANSVGQSDWNLRKLDKGDKILDYTKAQIIWFDFEWLGVGAVVFGFVIDRQLIPCHRFDHANSIDSTYMRHAKLPFRVEITESGSTTKSIKHICGSIMSEGGFELKGNVHSVGSKSFRDVDNSSTMVMALRIHPNHAENICVIPSNISVVVQSNQAVKCGRIAVHNNVTDLSTNWISTENGIVQYSYDPSITVTCDPVNIYYIESQNTLNLTGDNQLKFQLGRTINREPIPMAIEIGTLSSTISTATALTWHEI